MDRIAPLNVAEALQELPSDAKIRRYLPLLGPNGAGSVLFHPVPGTGVRGRTERDNNQPDSRTSSAPAASIAGGS